MKRCKLFPLIMAVVPVGFVSLARAQSTPSNRDHNRLQSPPSMVNVDGNLQEWGDSLRYYNAQSKLNYSLSNDKDNLYVAISLSDHAEQRRVLMAGITLSINTKGKKKESYSLTFPVAEAGASPFAGVRPVMQGEGNDEQPIDKEEMLKARLTKLRYMKVTGFKDVESELITTSNTYGFKAALNFDADGRLVYEAAIPLKFFGTDDRYKNEWAFDFRINGISKPEGEHAMQGGMAGGGMRGGMGRGGMGGGGMGGGRRGGGMGRGMAGGNNTSRADMAKPVDFWEKFYLAGN